MGLLLRRLLLWQSDPCSLGHLPAWMRAASDSALPLGQLRVDPSAAPAARPDPPAGEHAVFSAGRALLHAAVRGGAFPRAVRSLARAKPCAVGVPGRRDFFRLQDLSTVRDEPGSAPVVYSERSVE